MGTLTFQAALGGSVNLLGPNTASNINFTLPSADGSSGQPLQTNGSGTLSFANLAIANGGTGATSFTANQIHYGSFSQSAGLTFDGTNFATTGTATAAKLIPTGTSVTGNGMYLPATNALGFSTAGTNAVYIDASQNVGIGTSSPSTYGKFVISSTGAAQTILTGTDNGNGFIQYYGATGRLGYVGFGDSSSNLYFSNDKNAASIFLTNATERMRIDSSGNVGIGTSSPGYRLDVASGDTTAGQAIRIRANATSASGGLQFTDSAASSQYGWIKGKSTGLSFYGGNNSAGDVFIDASGNLLVGTTSAGVQNNISTTIENSGLNNARITVNHSSSGSFNGSYFMQFAYGGTLSGGITQATTTSVGFYTGPSDRRLKNSIEDLDRSGEFIDALKPRKWIWEKSGEADAGFVADELQAVIPCCVNGETNAVDEEGKPIYQMVDASPPEMIANIVAELKAIRKREKEQQALITSLTARIEALEAA